MGKRYQLYFLQQINSRTKRPSQAPPRHNCRHEFAARCSWIHTLRFSLEVAATIAFALPGVIAAARKRLDAVGVCVVAFVAALGGGTLRGLLLDQRPFFWIQHTEFVWGILALCIAAMLFMRQRHFQPTERAMLLPDAIGLGMFAGVGVDTATTIGMAPIIGVMMGVPTGVFGGVLRDVLCNEVPQALSDHRPYALCAFAGGWAHIALRHLQVPDWAPLAACAADRRAARAGAVAQLGAACVAGVMGASSPSRAWLARL